MSYRAAFWAVLAACAVLLAVLAMDFGRSAAPAAPSARPASSASSSAGSSTSMSGMSPSPKQPTTPLAPVQLSPQRLQSIGVRVGEVERRSVDDRILTTGNVAVDETKLAYVQLRFSGYIQQVFVDSTYQYVRRGQPLFTIYSPDLVSTEREYLLARDNEHEIAHSGDPEVVRDADSLVKATAARLKQWSIPQREIARLKSTGRVVQDLTIDSPVSGYVTDREALPNKFADSTTRLYTVAGLSTIWVFAQVYQNDLGRLKAGDPATLTVDTYPGRTFTGRVDFIYPDIDMTTRTARVRLVFPNPHLKLMPGMFVNVSLSAPMGEHTVIPASGVLQTGTRQIVFLDRGQGSLEPRDVQLGARVGNEFIVLKGLKAGERIVTSANFLIDSESQLQAALGAFSPPPHGAGAAPAPSASQASIKLTTDPAPPQKGNNVVRVKLAGAHGKPVADAQVTVTFFMPGMPAMGMAAMRVDVTLADHGGGEYEGSLALPGGGTWQVTVVAAKGGKTLATRELSVSVAGGT